MRVGQMPTAANEAKPNRHGVFWTRDPPIRTKCHIVVLDVGDVECPPGGSVMFRENLLLKQVCFDHESLRSLETLLDSRNGDG